MRLIGPNVNNELVVVMAASNTAVTLIWRSPTLDDQEEFEQSLYKRAGGELKTNRVTASVEWGSRLIQGFSDGAFAMPGRNGGAPEPISCDPESENYRADWRELLKEFAHDVLVSLAEVAFAGNKTLATPGAQEYTAKN